MMMILYYHNGSDNHGCEAIVRSSTALLDADCLYSFMPEIDIYYNLSEIISIKEDVKSKLSKSEQFFATLHHKLCQSDKLYTKYSHKIFFHSINHGDVYLSIGGDNYCYKGTEILAYYNKIIQENGAKTVLWGCSIEPQMVTEDMKKDFARYNLIVARESISYQFLKKINPNTIYACDPAFTLPKEELPFVEGEMVGINISPLIQKNEKIDGITYENYKNMIQYILDHTKYSIALIPHVVQPGNDDREPLMKLYNEIKDKKRVLVVDDCNCMQLKGYISRCILFIGARTHATIAAYSTYVPTLVIGYSTKAIGIARDLFGSEENYVLPVQSLSEPTQMTKAFQWLNEHKLDIRQHLMEVIPEYIKTVYEAAEKVKTL